MARLLFHGTSSDRAEKIAAGGFLPVAYFTTSVDDAIFYAATEGEADLQRREEAWAGGGMGGRAWPPSAGGIRGRHLADA